jgi:hypothetical protein
VDDDGSVSADGDLIGRPLTRTERSLLDSLLDREFDGVAELRVQVEHSTASTGCDCGCGMIELHVPASLPVSSAVSPVPVEGAVVDASGTPIGGILLFVEHGRLAGLEVYSYDEPLPLPVADRVRWESRETPDDAAPADATTSWWRRMRPPSR